MTGSTRLFGSRIHSNARLSAPATHTNAAAAGSKAMQAVHRVRGTQAAHPSVVHPAPLRKLTKAHIGE